MIQLSDCLIIIVFINVECSGLYQLFIYLNNILSAINEALINYTVLLFCRFCKIEEKNIW